MLTTNNSDSKWFDTVAAWAYAGGTPAKHLADDLRAAGKVVDPARGQDDNLGIGDEWGWLAHLEEAPDLEAPRLPDPLTIESDELDLEDDGPADAAPPSTITGRKATSRLGQRRRPQGKRPAGRILAVALAASVVVIVAVGAGLGMLFGESGMDSAPKDPVEVLADTGGMTAAVDDDCPEGVDGPVTTGNDSGDQESGPGVIKAFDYAYYVDRSGERARAVATPTGVGSTQALQASIDGLPPDTGHCLRITDRGNGLYAVQLTETRPGEQPIVYPQLIQTVQADGKTWIASIKKDTP
ncbi:hypothetical protein KB201_21175 [Gordonia sp. SCSIO 19800]|nr:hypothetical protein [Gordonia sp. SCSIO 19800]